MKKIIAMLLAGVLVLSFAGCGGGKGENTAPAESEAADDTEGKTALDILTDAWAGFPEENKFAIAGGDYDNMVPDAPGTVDVTKGENLDALFGFPTANASMLDDGASLMHMMNQNTFTAAAFHVTDAANLQTVADAVKENILVRQWMCGFPEELNIYTVGENYVVMVFGVQTMLDDFQAGLTAAYPSTALIVEENLM